MEPPVTRLALAAGTNHEHRPMESDTLAAFPYILVRLACTSCKRKGSYRLARLAEKYGADISLDDLLGKLAGDCRLWTPPRGCEFRCGAHFVDVYGPPRPPDLPPPVRRLRLVS